MSTSILTIGYANRTLEDLISLLKRERVQFLIDVRTNPSSKYKPEFSAEPLEENLRQAGLRYVFMGDALGGRPSDQSCYEHGHVVYQIVQHKDFFVAGIRRLLVASAKGVCVCLLCSESRPEDCHRSKLIGVSLAEHGVDVIHLDAQGNRIGQTDVLRLLDAGQTEMFDNSLRSRKAYRHRVVHTSSTE